MATRFRGGFTRRPSRRLGGNQLRPVEWNRFISGISQVSPSGIAELEMIPQEIFEDYTRPTIVRIRGRLTMYTADLTLGNEAFGAWGITLLNLSEAPPCPTSTGGGQRWMWWEGYHLVIPSTGGVADVEAGVNYQTHTFDVRSMRKADTDGNRLALLLDVAATATTGLQLQCSYSVLIKE